MIADGSKIDGVVSFIADLFFGLNFSAAQVQRCFTNLVISATVFGAEVGVEVSLETVGGGVHRFLVDRVIRAWCHRRRPGGVGELVSATGEGGRTIIVLALFR